MGKIADKAGNETLSLIYDVELPGEELESMSDAAALLNVSEDIGLALDQESAAAMLTGGLTAWNTPALDSCICDADLKKFGDTGALNGLLATA